MSHDVAVLPGDGIGTEVVPVAVDLLEAVSERRGFSVETTHYEMGAERYIERGAVMAPGTIDELAEYDAMLMGAVGHPDVDNSRVAAEGHHRIRREFDLYANVRPAVLFDESVCPLKGYGEGDVDVLWFRENSEGEYVDAGGRLNRAGETELAVQTGTFTRTGIERIARAACEAASARSGSLHSVTKSNVLSYGASLWDEVVEAVVETYPDVTLHRLFVDAAALRVVTAPETFDVAVGPNLFSDILTDVTAGVVGGLGLAPSANRNPDDDSIPGLYEPVHGTAPDIEGRGVANPLATVLSAAMLLEDLGESAAAADLRAVVREQVKDPDAPRTPDVGGDGTTEVVAADLRDRLETLERPD
jgi:tartrate dehydrogenase/decarboxylase/D-malate dehydrogenase